METNTIPSERLVVTPILDENQIKPSEASLDLRLGSVFLALRRGRVDRVDWADTESHQQLSFERLVVPVGSTFVLHPSQFVLAETLEFVRLPPDLMGYVVTKSSWGRAGLIVATAVGVHPNFRGVITLELRNLGEVPVTLRPGTSMLQLFLHKAAPPGADATRTYDGSIETTPPRPRVDPQLSRFINFRDFPLAESRNDNDA